MKVYGQGDESEVGKLGVCMFIGICEFFAYGQGAGVRRGNLGRVCSSVSLSFLCHEIVRTREWK